MPSYTRGKLRDVLTYVAINSKLFYGFKTKDFSTIAGISAADLTTQLGHLAANAVPNTGLLCIGANAPKPARVSKRIANAATTAQGSVGTFCGYTSLSSALSAGWTLAKGARDVALRTDGRTVTAVVELSEGGVLYAFPMNKSDFETYGSELGLQSASSLTTVADLNRLVRGSSLPRPGRASKKLAVGSIQSFYDPAKKPDLQQATSGWSVQSNALLLNPPATTP